MHPFYLRINRSRTDTAGYEEVFLLFQLFYILMDKLGRISKRSYEIMECIPSLEGAHLLGRSSHGLEYDRDRSCLTIKSQIVSGILSPSSPILTMTNSPGSHARATRGASTTIR